MKKNHFIILSIFAIVFLTLFTQYRLNTNTNIANDISSLPTEKLFVLVNADTLEYYFMEYINEHKNPSLKFQKKKSGFIISYNQNAPILLNRYDNNMKLEREAFSEIIQDRNGITSINLVSYTIDGIKYIHCPAPILIDLLMMKERSVNNE